MTSAYQAVRLVGRPMLDVWDMTQSLKERSLGGMLIPPVVRQDATEATCMSETA